MIVGIEDLIIEFFYKLYGPSLMIMHCILNLRMNFRQSFSSTLFFVFWAYFSQFV